MSGNDMMKISLPTSNPKYQTIYGEFKGIQLSQTPEKDSLVKATNVNTKYLPRLVGHADMEDCSISSSGAINQYCMFEVDGIVYVFGFDGQKMTLYKLNPDGNATNIYVFPETMTTSQAETAVTSVVFCGLDYGNNRGRRVLFYPLGYMATISEQTGELSGFLDLKPLSDMYGFIGAALYQNRIFATEGAYIYASRVETVVEFLPSTNHDESEEAPCRMSVESDGLFQRPILGLQVFGGNLYYFCQNSFGQIRGSSAANYRAEQLYSVGTPDMRSVHILGDQLYFMSENGLMAFDGNDLKCVSTDLGIERYEGGIGCVWKGQYYLGIPSSDKFQIYTYCPENDSWGSFRQMAGKLQMLFGGEAGFYCLYGYNTRYKIERITEREGSYFCQSSMHAPAGMEERQLVKVRVLLEMKEDSGADVMLLVMRKDGSCADHTLFKGYRGSGMVVLERTLHGTRGRKFSLAFSMRGGVAILGYEMIFKKEGD